MKNPKFAMNEDVWFKLTAKVDEFELCEWKQFTVVGIIRTSSTADVEYEYHLSNDPPEAYHNGKVNFSNVSEDKLLKEKPL